MVNGMDTRAEVEKIVVELRRGALALAALSQLAERQYGYSLKQRLAEQGMEIDEGTLYPLLRRLEKQGLLESAWDVEGSRPRRYYVLSAAGAAVLRELAIEWSTLTGVMDRLLTDVSGGHDGNA